MIQLNETTRISADARNVIIERLRTPKPKDGEEPKPGTWVPESYHGSLNDALAKLAREQVRLALRDGDRDSLSALECDLIRRLAVMTTGLRP